MKKVNGKGMNLPPNFSMPAPETVQEAVGVLELSIAAHNAIQAMVKANQAQNNLYAMCLQAVASKLQEVQQENVALKMGVTRKDEEVKP